MTCFCGKTALYQANGVGFCSDHREHAIRASKRLGSKKMGTSCFATTIDPRDSAKGGNAKAKMIRGIVARRRAEAFK